MEENLYHVRLVKQMIKFRVEHQVSVIFDSSHFKSLHPRLDVNQFVKEYKIHRDQDPYYETMIGAYLMDLECYYYIERFQNSYLLTKVCGSTQRVIVLDQNEFRGIHCESADQCFHMVVVGICYLYDIESHLFGI